MRLGVILRFARNTRIFIGTTYFLIPAENYQQIDKEPVYILCIISTGLLFQTVVRACVDIFHQ